MKTIATENTEGAGVGRISAVHPATPAPDALRLSGLRKLIGAILPQINEFLTYVSVASNALSPRGESAARWDKAVGERGARYPNNSTLSVPSVAKKTP